LLYLLEFWDFLDPNSENCHERTDLRGGLEHEAAVAVEPPTAADDAGRVRADACSCGMESLMATDRRRRMAPTTVTCSSKVGPPCAARSPAMRRQRRPRAGSGVSAHTEYTSSTSDDCLIGSMAMRICLPAEPDNWGRNEGAGGGEQWAERLRPKTE
jgi:hypothetical protein